MKSEMPRREFVKKGAAVTAAAASVSVAQRAPAKAQTPNIVYIFTDDQRFDTIRALGNPHIITPSLDRLAQRSFVFRNAYCFGGNSAAVCIPSRNMNMTGQTFFSFGTPGRDWRKSPRATGAGPTLPKSMKAAGYETFYREKSGRANLPTIQTQFDHFKDVHMVNALRTGYAARSSVDDAIAFLQRERDATRPFFMYLGLPCPHDPRWSAKEFRDMYSRDTLPVPPNYRPVHAWDIGSPMTVRDERLEAWPRTEDAVRRHLFDYYALITSMDRDIGRLLDALDDMGLTDDTLIVFSSDQGLAMGSHGLMGKQSLYEDVMKVPMLFAGPGIPKGESDALCYIHDVYPTLCELIGTTVPDGLDGRSLAPILHGRADRVRDVLLLAYMSTQRSVRDDAWKLIRYPEIDRTQLFNLAADPRETQNLADDPAQSDRVASMMALLGREQKRVGDPIPLTVPEPKPAEFKPPAKKLRTPFPAGGLAPGAE